jgi:hypothetical protein
VVVRERGEQEGERREKNRPAHEGCFKRYTVVDLPEVVNAGRVLVDGCGMGRFGQ